LATWKKAENTDSRKMALWEFFNSGVEIPASDFPLPPSTYPKEMS